MQEQLPRLDTLMEKRADDDAMYKGTSKLSWCSTPADCHVALHHSDGIATCTELCDVMDRTNDVARCRAMNDLVYQLEDVRIHLMETIQPYYAAELQLEKAADTV